MLGTFWIGQFVDDDQRTALRTQLLRFEPTEILIHKKALRPATEHLLHQECPFAMITPVDPNKPFSSSALVSLVETAHLFDNAEKPEQNGQWPEALRRLMKDAHSFKPEFEISMSCLFLCVAYLNRCCVANLLMSARAFSFIDSIDAGLGCGVI